MEVLLHRQCAADVVERRERGDVREVRVAPANDIFLTPRLRRTRHGRLSRVPGLCRRRCVFSTCAEEVSCLSTRVEAASSSTRVEEAPSMGCPSTRAEAFRAARRVLLELDVATDEREVV